MPASVYLENKRRRRWRNISIEILGIKSSCIFGSGYVQCRNRRLPQHLHSHTIYTEMPKTFRVYQKKILLCKVVECTNILQRVLRRRTPFMESEKRSCCKCESFAKHAKNATTTSETGECKQNVINARALSLCVCVCVSSLARATGIALVVVVFAISTCITLEAAQTN